MGETFEGDRDMLGDRVEGTIPVKVGVAEGTPVGTRIGLKVGTEVG